MASDNGHVKVTADVNLGQQQQGGDLHEKKPVMYPVDQDLLNQATDIDEKLRIVGKIDPFYLRNSKTVLVHVSRFDCLESPLLKIPFNGQFVKVHAGADVTDKPKTFNVPYAVFIRNDAWASSVPLKFDKEEDLSYAINDFFPDEVNLYLQFLMQGLFLCVEINDLSTVTSEEWTNKKSDDALLLVYKCIRAYEFGRVYGDEDYKNIAVSGLVKIVLHTGQMPLKMFNKGFEPYDPLENPTDKPCFLNGIQRFFADLFHFACSPQARALLIESVADPSSNKMIRALCAHCSQYQSVSALQDAPFMSAACHYHTHENKELDPGSAELCVERYDFGRHYPPTSKYHKGRARGGGKHFSAMIKDQRSKTHWRMATKQV